MQPALSLALAFCLSSLGSMAPPPPTGPAPAPPAAETKQASEAATPEGEEPAAADPEENSEDIESEESAPPEQAEPAAPTPSDAPLVDPAEVARLQEEAKAVRGELFKARARVSAVTAKLFKSKVVLELRSNLERFYEVKDFTITIDGAPVYFKESGLAPVRGSIVEMFAAPGSHEMGISAHLTAKRQKLYQIRIDQTFTVVVPEDSQLRTRFMVHELGNMFGKFDKRKRGVYRMHVELRAKAKANKKKKRKAAVTATGKASVGK